MLKKWHEQEDQYLCQLMEKGRQRNWKDHYILHFISHRLGRTVKECQERLQQQLNESLTKQRINQLEVRMNKHQEQLQQLIQDNEKLKRDLRFYEAMLFEQYQLVLRILGENTHFLHTH